MKKLLSVILSIMLVIAMLPFGSVVVLAESENPEQSNVCTDGGEHNWVMTTDKASFGKSGMTYAKCSKCGKKEPGFPILSVDASIEAAAYTFDGKAKKPKVNVSTADGPLDKKYYKVKFIDNVYPGTATVKITLVGDYFEGTKKFTFPIVMGDKVKNPVTVKAKKPVVKYAKLKKGNQTIALKKAIAVSKAQGKVTYKKTKGYAKITINKKTGKITLKKGIKKGSYKIKFKVTAAGNKYYKKGVKTVTVKIKVK